MRKIFLTLLLVFFLILLFKTNQKILRATDNVGPWSSTTSIPYQIASHLSFIDSGKLNIVSGATNTTTSEAVNSNINLDGTLSLWNSSIIDYPTAVYWHGFARKGNYIYGLGGATFPPTNSISTVYLGILSGGEATSWTTTIPLPNQLAQGNAVVVGNRIYFAGGFKMVNGSFTEFSNKVYMADINPDGTLGSWSETTPLPSSLFGFGMVKTGTKIVIIGGRFSNFSYTDKVYEASINPDGTLGSWTEMSPLPQAVYRSGVVRVGNQIISVGGDNAGTMLSNVYYADIDGSGSVGAWSSSANSLPQGICCGSLAASDTHLYLTGGFNGGYVSTVYYASFGASPPSPTPTATPTPIPTPTPTPSFLSIPDVKQYSSPWNDDIYDQATNWSLNPTIERWGCALTSASMVLKYYNHDYNPDTLNNWLVGEPDGYLRNGLLNWLAVSRFTRINSDIDSPALEYRRLGTDPSLLISEINQGRPGILKLPGHFVVAKGNLLGDFAINDPTTSRTLLSQYTGTYLALNRYKPTSTDLSYILVVADPDLSLTLLDESGNPVGETFLDEPLVDDVDGISLSGELLSILIFPTPQAGNYTLEVKGGSGVYNLETYFYDPDGNVEHESLEGVGGNLADFFEINYSGNSSLSKNITIDSLINDFDSAYNDGYIYNQKVYQSTKERLKIAKRFIDRGRNSFAKPILFSVKATTKAFTPRYFDPTVSSILQSNTQALINSL